MTDLLASEQSFADAFILGLRDRALSHSAAQQLIALSHCLASEWVRTELAALLRARLPQWARAPGMAEPPAAPPSLDEQVLQRAAELGLDALEVASERPLGPWRARFAPLRSLRPRRAAASSLPAWPQAFDPAAFHFHAALLATEGFGRLRLAGRECHLLYNKYPLGPFGGLLVPEPEAGLAQQLDGALASWAWQALERLGSVVPAATLGFNSLGACASVNHLHLHLLVEQAELPIAAARWAHNGGNLGYPLRVEPLGSPQELGQWLRQALANRSAHHLVLRPGRGWGIERLPQAAVAPAAWTTGVAFLEIAGIALLAERASFAALEASSFEQELARVGGQRA